MKSLVNPFSVLRHLDLWSVAAFDSSGGGGGGGGGGGSSSGGSSSGGSSTTTTTPVAPTVPVYDNYYDAIDAEGVGATVNINGNTVAAVTADGYTGSGSYDNNPGQSKMDADLGYGGTGSSSSSGGTDSGGGSDNYVDPYDIDYGDVSDFYTDPDPDPVFDDPAPVYTQPDVISTPVDTLTPDDLDAFGGAGPDISTGTNTGTNTGTDYGYNFDDENYTPTLDELNDDIAANDGINLTDPVYAEDVDYTTTGSGNDYTAVAEADTDVPYVAPVIDTTPEPVAPSVYYDALGNPYGSSAEASAAEAAAEAASAQAARDAAIATAASFEDEARNRAIAYGNQVDAENEYEVMSQPVAPVISPEESLMEMDVYDPIVSGGTGTTGIDTDDNVSRFSFDSTDPDDPLAFLSETNELLAELGVNPIGVDTSINLEKAGATRSITPSVITDLAMGGEDYTPSGDELTAQLDALGQTDMRESQFDVDMSQPKVPNQKTENLLSEVEAIRDENIQDLADGEIDQSEYDEVTSALDQIEMEASNNPFDKADKSRGYEEKYSARDSLRDQIAAGDFDGTILGEGEGGLEIPTSGESLTDDTLGASPSFETQEEAIDRALREALGDDIPTAEQISPEDFRENEAALAGIDFNTGLPIGGTTPDEDIEKGGVLYESTIDSIKDRVSDVEGTSDAGGYDRLLGGQEGNFGVNPSTMTIAEVLAFQAKRGEGSYASYSQDVNKKNNQLREDGTPKISTPVGKYQVVGSTLQGLVDNGIVDPNEKFDEATQERIGTYLIENRGFQDSLDGKITEQQFEENLGKEFQGIEFQGYNSDGTSTADPQLANTATAVQLSELKPYTEFDDGLSNKERLAAVRALDTKNTTKENLANSLTPDDGAEYINGQLVDSLTGKSLTGGGYATNSKGEKDYIYGVADSQDNNLKVDTTGMDERQRNVAEANQSALNDIPPSDLAYLSSFIPNILSPFGTDFGLGEYLLSGGIEDRRDMLEKEIAALKAGAKPRYNDDGEYIGHMTYDDEMANTFGSGNIFTEDYKGASTVNNGLDQSNKVIGEGSYVAAKGETSVVDQDILESNNNSGDDDSNICEAGFAFDPVEGICMPIDTIGDGTGRRKVKIKKRTPRTVDPVDPVLPTPRPTTGGLAVRQPSFNKGGVVTRNIDKFANGGVVTPNIDNFFGSMR